MDLWLDAIRTAWQTITGHRLRSALTALTFALGSAAVVLMLSLAQSAVDTIYSGFDAAGGRELVFVQPARPKGNVAHRGTPRLTPDDAAALDDRLPNWSVSYLFKARGTAQVGNKKTKLDVAAGLGYQRLMLMHVVAGRDLTEPTPGTLPPREIVLAKPAAIELFGSTANALGESIIIWGHSYQVVGISDEMKQVGFNMGTVDKKRVAFVTPQALVQREGMAARGFIVMRDMAGMPSHDRDLALAQVVLQHRHHGVVDFEFSDLQKLISGIDKTFLALKVIIALIAALSLFIAGAGVMNVLLASVRQRVGEIGIRRALGASGGDIRRQFLVESAMISLLGGGIGVATGLAMSELLGLIASSAVPGWSGSISWTGVLVGLGAAAVTGLTFGLRPARKAASLQIVSCLRGDTRG